MAHVRQDTLCRPTEWWKHMREEKRVMSKKERKASRKEIEKDFIDVQAEQNA